jgi:hypothetical protein
MEIRGENPRISEVFGLPVFACFEPAIDRISKQGPVTGLPSEDALRRKMK